MHVPYFVRVGSELLNTENRNKWIKEGNAEGFIEHTGIWCCDTV